MVFMMNASGDIASGPGFFIFRQIDFDNTKWSEDWDQVDLESVSHESLMGPIDSTILWLKIWEPKTWFWVFFPKF